jgi:hypothetical protein
MVMLPEWELIYLVVCCHSFAAMVLGNYVIRIWEVVLMTLSAVDLFYHQWLAGFNYFQSLEHY